MLLELNINNYVLIEQETINFTTDLNIITGETGAGKSLVIDAIQAVVGGRLNKEDIRQGAAKAVIEALFAINNIDELQDILDSYGLSLEEDNMLLITREVNTSGRSISRINGQIVTLSMLRSITESIVDIVGQNEHQLLLNSAKHMDFVDNFGDSLINTCKDDIKQLISMIREAEKKLEDICGNTAERERRLDLLNFQINEIDSSKLRAEEENDLKSRKILLSNSEKLFKNISAAYQKIFKGEGNLPALIDILNQCTSLLSEAAFIDMNLNSFKDTLEGAVYQLEDLKNDIRSYRDNIEFNDSEIDLIEERLDLINKLKRKYGSTISEILEYRDKSAAQKEELINSEKLATELEKKLEELKKSYIQKASELSELRKKSAAKLEKLVEKELQDLNMQGAAFKIIVESDDKIISVKGIDKVEFMISPNPGEPEKPLNKIASGGEMSRIMLAIKNALSNTERLSCIVFDEVDAGIGGITATLVGQKIKAISKNVQTICITHLPQIASFGQNHILIQKTIEDNKTSTKLKVLNKEERVIEVARMMGGDINNKSSLNHAKELIKNSK